MDRVTSVHPTQFFKFGDVLIGQETIFSLNNFQNNISRLFIAMCSVKSCGYFITWSRETNKQKQKGQTNKQHHLW